MHIHVDLVIQFKDKPFLEYRLDVADVGGKWLAVVCGPDGGVVRKAVFEFDGTNGEWGLLANAMVALKLLEMKSEQ